MHKAFSKKRVLPVFLALAISSVPAIAGYSSDPDCKAVSDGANAGASRAKDQIDNAIRKISDSIELSKNCADQLNSAMTRIISDSSFASLIPDSVKQGLTNKGCQMLSSAQTELTNQVKGQINAQIGQVTSEIQSATSGVIGQLPGFVQGAANQRVQAATQAATGAIQNEIASQIGSQIGGPGSAAPPAQPSIMQRIRNIF